MKFKYKTWLTMLTLSVTSGLFIFFVSLFDYFLHMKAIFDALICISLALMLLFILSASLTRATIVVTEEAISSAILGVLIRTIPWDEVKEVKKVAVSNGYTTVATFYIADGKATGLLKILPNTFGNIVFTQSIGEFDGLLSVIKEYSRQYGFSLDPV